MKPVRLGHLFGIEFQLHPQSLLYSLGIWVLLSAIVWVLYDWSIGETAVWGFCAMLLHWFADVIHHLGHAWAGKRQGYSLEMLRFQHFLIGSRYPRDEPELPAELHIRRALGGPFFSMILTLIAGILLVLLQSAGEFVAALAWFFFLENLLVFFLGAFLPLGFTDGSTLLHYWPQRKK